MSSFVKKFKEMWIPPEDEYDYEFEDEVEEMSSSNEHEDNKLKEKRKSTVSSSANKVVNIHTTAQLQVVLFKPEHFGEDTRTMADELLKMHTVVLNMENTSKDISRRILDFLSGVAYANNGKIKRIATATFIITPYNVDIMGDDLIDELENSGVYF